MERHLFQRVFLVVATLFCTLLLAACDRIAPDGEDPSASTVTDAKVGKVAAKPARACATQEKRVKSAWNQLRASLRHGDESNESVVTDDDDDDDDDPDLTTISIWDDFNDDGSTGDANARACADHRPRDTRPSHDLFVSSIRKARGQDGSTERPPRG